MDFLHGTILHSLVELGVVAADELGAHVSMRQWLERFFSWASFLHREAFLKS